MNSRRDKLNPRPRRLLRCVVLLMVMVFVSGCLGEDPTRVDRPRTIQFGVIAPGGVELPDLELGVVFSERDAELNGHETLLMYDLATTGYTVTLKLNNFFYADAAHNPGSRCFEDPIVVRSFALGEDLLEIEDYCPEKDRNAVFIEGLFLEPPQPTWRVIES